MGGSFHLTWEEGREGRAGGSFHLTPSPFMSPKTAFLIAVPQQGVSSGWGVKEPVPSLIHSSLAAPLCFPNKISSAWEEYREGSKGGRELSSHLGGRKGGKGGRELSSHPIAIHVGKSCERTPARERVLSLHYLQRPIEGEGAAPVIIIYPELVAAIVGILKKEIERLGGRKGGR